MLIFFQSVKEIPMHSGFPSSNSLLFHIPQKKFAAASNPGWRDLCRSGWREAGRILGWYADEERRSRICGFPIMGVPQNGWFIMENPIEFRMMTRGTLILGDLHIMWDGMTLLHLLEKAILFWCNLMHRCYSSKCAIYIHLRVLGTQPRLQVSRDFFAEPLQLCVCVRVFGRVRKF